MHTPTLLIALSLSLTLAGCARQSGPPGMVQIAVATLLGDPAYAARLGEAAHRTVVERYLGDRHLIQYADMFSAMLRHSPTPAG